MSFVPFRSPFTVIRRRVVLLAVALIVVLAACSDSPTSIDGERAEAPTPTADVAPPADNDNDPTDEPADEPANDRDLEVERAQRVAVLEAIVAPYPGVRVELVGDVAVVVGVVESFDDKVTIDDEVRAAGFAISNEVNVVGGDDEAPPLADGYTLLDLVQAQPELSHLAQLLERADLSSAIGDPASSITLLAPTDDAFAAWVGDPALDAAAFDAWLDAAPIDVAALANNHLIDGSVSLADLDAVGETTTRHGDPLTDSVDYLVNDVDALNGTMHIITTVALPSRLWADVPDELATALGLEPITFAPGGATLTDEGREQLDLVAAYLLERPGLLIEVGGHTDADGAEETNDTLSLSRAEAVVRYLAGAGVDDDTLTAVGYGEGSPIAPNDTAENKALNRRIEFRPA